MSFNLQRITAEIAEAEPEDERLFGPSYKQRQAQLRRQAQVGVDRKSYDPWGKPVMKRRKKREH